MSSLPVSACRVLLLLAGSLAFAGCATTSLSPVGPAVRADTAPSRPLPEIAATPRPQGGLSMAQMHPRRMVSLGLAGGQEHYQFNNGAGVNGGSNDSFRARLRGDYFFESELGIHVDTSLGQVDSIFADNSSLPRGNLRSKGAFVALAYRATMDDFRMPVRFGPYMQNLKDGSTSRIASSGNASTTYDSIGVRLSAEPEYILKRWVSDGKASEMTVFADFGCGAGQATVEDGLDKERGYSFIFSLEAGARFKLQSGLMIGLSWFTQKYHVSSTDTYRNARNVVFYGIDDDFQAIMLTFGLRF